MGTSQAATNRVKLHANFPMFLGWRYLQRRMPAETIDPENK